MDTKQPTDIAITSEKIVDKIFVIRGQKVMLDKDLAEMYGVESRALNQAVKRSISRFPEDFMFQLSKEEFDSLRSQFVISKKGRGGVRYLPYAFTEQGVAMLSSVLRSETAIQVNIQIIRVFTKMKQLLMDNKDLLLRVEKIEHHLLKQDEDTRAGPHQTSPNRGGFRTVNNHLFLTNLKVLFPVFAHSLPRWGRIGGGRAS